jgi:CHAT domain-containing protein
VNGLQLKSSIGSSKEKLENEAYLLAQEYDLFIRELSANYPQYDNLKYKYIIDLKKAKDTLLDDNQALLTFFDGEQYLYFLFITNSEEFFFRIEKDEVYNNNLMQLLKLVYSPDYLNNLDQGYQNFVKNSYYIFDKIFQDVDVSQINSMIVIPDGALTYLPFEALTTEQSSSKTPDFRNLPYLIKKLSLSYSSSATILSNNLQNETNTNPHLLGIGYYNNNESNSNLSGTQNELLSLESYWPYEKNILYDGSETIFKEIVSNYDIIHLGLHGSVDSTSIEGTQLFFKSGGETDDGILKAHELYELNINAQMVFLSACETGFGKQSVSEGVFSLSRGFIYAGSRSVIQTLWKINDQISASIIEDFYINLTSNNSSQQALRNAKLTYINQADELAAHPYNWAAFQYVGADYQLVHKYYRYYVILAVCLILIAIFIVRRFIS